MSTVAKSRGIGTPDPPYAVARVEPASRLAAAGRLVPGGRGDPFAARRLLEAAEANGLDMAHLWASSEPGGFKPRQVCLAVVGSGRSAMLFTSTPVSPADTAELSAVIDGACSGLADVRIAQALLDPGETPAERAFLGAGFVPVGRLAYMRRSLGARAQPLPTDAPPEGLTIRSWVPSDDAGLVAALDATYIDTLDCPELCGMRLTSDVLESHRSTGVFEPDLWTMVEQEGRIVGVMLLNPCPDQGSVELVYLGLAPEVRGKGLGRLLMRRGLAQLAGRRERTIACAVDERNTPARRVYGAMGFIDFAHRAAFVRPLGVRAPRTP